MAIVILIFDGVEFERERILLELLMILFILLISGYLLNIGIIIKNKFNYKDLSLLTILTSILLLIFDTLLLTGRFALPLLGKIININIYFSIYHLGLLLIIEMLLLLIVIFKKYHLSFFEKNIMQIKSLLNNVVIPNRHSIVKFLLILFCLNLVVGPHIYYLVVNKMPTTPLVWTYHHLTTSVVKNGTFPIALLRYGKITEFDATYIGYNLLSCSLYSIIKCEDIIFLKLMTIFTIIISFIFALAFFSRLISFPYSLATTVVIFLMKLFIYKLATFRTEALAICFMFMSSWVVQKAITDKDNRLLVVGGITIAVGVTINASVSLISVSIILATLLTNSIFKTNNIYQFKQVGILSIIGLSVTIIIFFLSVGRIPIIGSMIPKNLSSSPDPTWGFLRALQPSRDLAPSFSDYMPDYVYNDFTNNSALIMLLISLAGVMYWKFSPSRKLILYMIFFTIIITAISFFFYNSYHTYVPSRSGFQRIFPYLYISWSFIPFIILRYLPNVSFNIRHDFIIKIYYKPIVAFSLILLLFMCNLPFLVLCHGGGISDEGYRALLWLRENTDPQSTKILTNEWASGSTIGISNRNFLNDGDAPYLRPGALPMVNLLIEKSREFYRSPNENLDFLIENNVTHVLVSYKRSLRGVPLLPDFEISEALLMGAGLHPILDLNNVKIYDTTWMDINLEDNNSINIYEDDEMFWTRFQTFSGNYSVTLDEEKGVKGNSCLSLTIGMGNYQRVGVAHQYNETQDFRRKDFFCLYFYGKNSGETIVIILYAPNGNNYYRYKCRDIFTGWARLIIPLTSFTSFGTPNWSKIKSIYIFFDEITSTGTWYLDRTFLAIFPVEGN